MECMLNSYNFTLYYQTKIGKAVGSAVSVHRTALGIMGPECNLTCMELKACPYSPIMCLSFLLNTHG